MYMKNLIAEATPKHEEEEDGENEKTSTVTNGPRNHLRPKTKETDLRLGFSTTVNGGFCKEKGSKRLITTTTIDHDDQMLPGFAVGKQNKNDGCSFGTNITTTTKRSCSETTQAGFGNPWESSCKPKQEKADFQSPPLSRASPVVGWPPVRAFRRNLTSPLKPAMDSKDVAVSSVEALKKSTEDLMYVKVNIEGYAVGRKINLKAHDSYESLSQALQKMFDNFLSVNYSRNQDNAEESEEVPTTKHVLVYEDNEGDRVLVGDVPWEMFISTVKRLYIISGSRAPAIEAGGEGKTHE